MPVNIEIHTPGEPVRSETFDEPAEFMIGRNPDCACCLKADGLVSRKHAVLLVEPPSIMVKDLKSTNGITVNGVKRGGAAGHPVTEPLPLSAGSVVVVGKTSIRITLAEDASFAPRLTEAAASRRTAPVVGAPGSGGGGLDFAASGLPEVPGYKLLKVIGTGGMGSVYLAESSASGEMVAIKLMAGAMAMDKRMVETFRREIAVTETVRHPNIVRFFDAGSTGLNQLYLALEYVDGGDVLGYMRTLPGRKLPLDVAYRFMVEVADGMAYAHGLGFIHRDMKPHNLLVTCGGERHVKISDLGLAKNFESAGMSGLTNSFTGGGTMAYMPPEQLTDFRDVTPSADVFGMAATFYEMLTGRIVYDFSQPGDSLKAVSHCRLVPLRKYAEGVPPALMEVLEKSLSAAPEGRYADAGEMLSALKDAAP